MGKARWMETQITNDSKMLVDLSNANVQRELARCAATLSIRLSAIKAASSEAVPSAK